MITETNNFMINAETGEIIEIPAGTKITTSEEQQFRKNFLRKKEKFDLEKFFKNKTLEKHGKFVWQIYKPSETYNNSLKPATITRLIYLATYLDIDGSLIDYEPLKNKKIYLTKKDIFDRMRLKETAFKNFFKELQDKNLIMEHENKWHLKKTMFNKGLIPDRDIAVLSNKGYYIIRLYQKAIRELYEKSKPTSHRTLSYLYQIIPFVNREYNIVCFNPFETDLQKIKRMKLSDYCEVVGIDKKYVTKVFKALWDLSFTTNRGKECAVTYVSNKGVQKGNFFIYINPYVYYAGTKWDKVEILGTFCKEEEGNNENNSI